MPAGIQNFILEQGETFNPVITWTTSGGTAINITGYSARMQVRKDTSSTSSILECTDGNGRLVLGGSAGTVTFNVSATDTAALPTGNYAYDLELVSGGGVVTKLIKGRFEIRGEVTR